MWYGQSSERKTERKEEYRNCSYTYASTFCFVSHFPSVKGGAQRLLVIWCRCWAGRDPENGQSSRRGRSMPF